MIFASENFFLKSYSDHTKNQENEGFDIFEFEIRYVDLQMLITLQKMITVQNTYFFVKICWIAP